MNIQTTLLFVSFVATIVLSFIVVPILKKKKITQVKQLANQSKTKLKDIGLLGYQISEIEVKLQLEGLDLKGNY